MTRAQNLNLRHSAVERSAGKFHWAFLVAVLVSGVFFAPGLALAGNFVPVEPDPEPIPTKQVRKAPRSQTGDTVAPVKNVEVPAGIVDCLSDGTCSQNGSFCSMGIVVHQSCSNYYQTYSRAKLIAAGLALSPSAVLINGCYQTQSKSSVENRICSGKGFGGELVPLSTASISSTSNKGPTTSKGCATSAGRSCTFNSSPTVWVATVPDVTNPALCTGCQSLPNKCVMSGVHWRNPATKQVQCWAVYPKAGTVQCDGSCR